MFDIIYKGILNSWVVPNFYLKRYEGGWYIMNKKDFSISVLGLTILILVILVLIMAIALITLI